MAPSLPSRASRRPARIAAAVSVALYLLACALPVLEFQKSAKPDVWVGIGVLAMGWMGLLVGIFAWLANPIGLLALILAATGGRPMPTRILAGIAFLTGCTVFAAIGMELPGDEGGVTKMLLGRVREGSFVWIASLLATVVAAFLIQDSRK